MRPSLASCLRGALFILFSLFYPLSLITYPLLFATFVTVNIMVTTNH